ncbi:MAG: DUF362 domain-containing protein [Deltaproteobacteria bacterium]|nr:DUF362 domain-containing protein [Deltaproteobacteria bacterium]
MSQGPGTLSRRKLLGATLAAGVGAAVGGSLLKRSLGASRSRVFVGKAKDYSVDLADLLRRGLAEAGVGREQIGGRRVLLKPNLVDTNQGQLHVNTHPEVIRAAAEVFLKLGAASVLVAEGPANRRDTHEILEATGVGEVLREDRIPFRDLNYEPGPRMPNAGGLTRLSSLVLPAVVSEVDYIVSVAKMKCHHWAGVTLSMKNLFGMMPGCIYGWPKNILHHVGLHDATVDIATTIGPDLAIVDGIVGMEGDGPLAGDPKPAGLLVVGSDLRAVDATCARIMGVDPLRVPYLADSVKLGVIAEADIREVGEAWRSVRDDFALIPFPEHQALRLVRLGSDPDN